MNHRLGADVVLVSQTSIRSIEALDHALEALGADHELGAAGSLRLVIGPGGVFVVGLAAGNPEVGHEVAVASRSTRDTLADHLSYPPFVDAVVIDDDNVVSHDEANIVPSDLLEAAFGGHCLGEDVVALLTKQLQRGALEPWSPLRAEAMEPPARSDQEVALDLAFLNGAHKRNLAGPGT